MHGEKCKAEAYSACCCSSIQRPNGGAFPEVKALQDAVISSTAKQAMHAGYATGIDARRLCRQRRQETALGQIQPAHELKLLGIQKCQ